MNFAFTSTASSRILLSSGSRQSEMMLWVSIFALNCAMSIKKENRVFPEEKYLSRCGRSITPTSSSRMAFDEASWNLWDASVKALREAEFGNIAALMSAFVSKTMYGLLFCSGFMDEARHIIFAQAVFFSLITDQSKILLNRLLRLFTTQRVERTHRH